MRHFKDNAGRVWDVEINVAQVKYVRDVLRIDLYKVGADNFKLYHEIIGDPVRLIDLLYCLCKKQADARNLTDEAFGQAFAGDVIGKAAEAFSEELIDFFPSAATQAAMRTVLSKAREIKELIALEAQAALEAIQPAEILATMRLGYGKPLEPLVSTPDPSPSAS